ncbi:MAG TPA: type II toxin-antitoxin system RelE/ParE family toxin [Chloroflexia bacterium]|nr:type II toxin-antitoxin system RelE/ParE family toxin [Chloroflexia bacterium]
MTYTITFAKRAERQFRALPREVQVRLKARIDALAENSRPQGVEKLSAEDNLYRIRSGDYRVIYEIRDAELLILVAKVGHRREVYR